MSALRNNLLLLLGMLVVAGESIAARTFPMPGYGTDIVGGTQTVTAHASDTLLDIARLYGLGYEDIRRANPELDMWLPGAGAPVLLPTEYILPDGPREGIVINVPEMRLYYFVPARRGKPREVVTFPLSIGRREWSTPFGRTAITVKVKDPVWYPPQSVRQEQAAEGRLLEAVVPPGPDNPLGKFALGLDLPGYFIHGTNRPYGIGLRVTHGCLRLYPEDIEMLFRNVPVGTPVHIVNQPYKVGWRDGTLYLEAHDPLEEMLDGESRNYSAAVMAIIAATRDRNASIEWERVRNVVRRASGLAVPISTERFGAEKIASVIDGIDANDSSAE